MPLWFHLYLRLISSTFINEKNFIQNKIVFNLISSHKNIILSGVKSLEVDELIWDLTGSDPVF